MTTQAGYNLTSSDGTTAQAGVGDIANICGAVYQYFKATAATIAAYSACSGGTPAAMEEATTTTVTALGTGGGLACIPQFDVGASEYFWAPIGPFYLREDGSTAFKVLAANATAGALLNSTATDGVLDDATTKAINGLALSATATTQAATACVAFKQLSWVI